jgi:hypothetical protein
MRCGRSGIFSPISTRVHFRAGRSLHLRCVRVFFRDQESNGELRITTAEREIADEHRLNALRNRCTNLRQTIEAGFCLFGVIRFLPLQTVGLIVMGSAVEAKILGSFRRHCAFATNVIAIFFVLPMIQWIVAGRVSTCSEQLIKKGLLGLECRNIAVTLKSTLPLKACNGLVSTVIFRV